MSRLISCRGDQTNRTADHKRKKILLSEKTLDKKPIYAIITYVGTEKREHKTRHTAGYCASTDTANRRIGK
jgi:hypothetical protein